mgnify:CR=1 FL=1
MSSRILPSLIVRPLLLSAGVRHGSLPMSVETHICALPHPVGPATSGMGMAWCRRRRVVPPLHFSPLCSMVALVRYRSCSWIVDPVVVWICSRPFSLTASLRLFRNVSCLDKHLMVLKSIMELLFHLIYENLD